MAEERKRPESEVDYVVDENASRVDVPAESHIANARDREATFGATGPTNWWRTGLIGLAIVIALLLAMQLLGGWPGTDVQPGTPVADPQTTPASGAG